MYPKTIDKANDGFASIREHKTSRVFHHNRTDVIFYQKGSGNQTCTPVAGTYYILHRDVMCYNCDRHGHYSSKFALPDHHMNGTQSLQLGYYFAQTNPVHRNLINPNYILIDSCYVMSSVINTFLIRHKVLQH